MDGLLDELKTGSRMKFLCGCGNTREIYSVIDNMRYNSEVKAKRIT